METFIVAIVLILIIGSAAWYVYKEKKNGRKCIGCPDACSCASGGYSGCSGCHHAANR